MADIDLERKRRSGAGWLWWVVGLLALVAVVWWVWPDTDDEFTGDVDMERVEPVTAPAPAGGTPGGSLGDILTNPDQYVGQSFPGAEVTVAEVPTDRGFWIEDAGERLFAVIIDEPQEQPKDINPGQTLRIDGGTLRDRGYIAEMPGAPLDAATEEILQGQDIFLVVDERYITVLEGGEPQPGTDPAEGVEPQP